MQVARRKLQQTLTPCNHGFDDDLMAELHTLLSQHGTVDTVQRFLFENFTRFCNPKGNISRMGQCAGNGNCNALHIAAFRNAWKVEAIFESLLDYFPFLAAERMEPCGSYPLHIFVGQTLTVNLAPVQTLVKAATPEIIFSEDCQGDNALSLLYKNTLRFRWAQRWDGLGLAPIHGMDSKQSTLTIISPQDYKDISLFLVSTAANKSTQDLTLHDICFVPRCPVLLVRMIMMNERYKKQLLFKDQTGRLPLHCAVQARTLNRRCMPSHMVDRIWSLVKLLHHLAPEAAAIVDKTGRLPIHYAVLHADTTETIRHLVNANTAALGHVDPISSLFPAQAIVLNPFLSDDDKTELIFECLNLSPNVLL